MSTQPQSLSETTRSAPGDDQITFKLSAERWMGDDAVGLNATARVETKEEAQVIAARFRKSAKVTGTTLTGHIDSDLLDIPWVPGLQEWRTVGYVTFRVHFERNGVTGWLGGQLSKRLMRWRKRAS
jgi:hypothetical protein